MMAKTRLWHIAGQGAIGSFCAHNLHHEGVPYQPISRRMDAKASRFVIEDSATELRAPKQLKQLQQIENLLIPLKAYDVIPFLTNALSHLATGANVVLCHNGMGTIDKALEILPKHCRLYFCTTSSGAFKRGQDLVLAGIGESYWNRIETSPSRFELSEVIETGTVAPLQQSDFLLLFQQAKHETELTKLLWHKLIVNSVINPLTAIHGVTNGQLLDAEFAPQVDAIIQECVNVARSISISLDFKDMQQWVRTVMQATANNQSSMLQDIRAKRPTEIDFINGYVVNLVSDSNLACPQNQSLVQQVKLLEPN